LAWLTRAEVDEDLSWFDVLGLALLGGLGFTVSLLIGEQAFGVGSERDNHVKLAVLIGSLLAATLATVVLRIHNGVYRRIEEAEAADDDADGVPDIYPSP
jgi:Na+:H+ antiporter, NhaA family